ncbi:hypothetical protein ACTOB_003037 [Actinoplanes oblitus]|uniref:Uncharacterized protein n=1 Tax=Actinoplanes oblitus TaxID=3040509 RepID=A0ABY8WND8_9ACTN|nr:hypothetical protein [Actinoplanes oblitus]WIM99386.1 hypothetical protein ACTOB_003037 [Actinoplanes oblitus]
MTNTGSSSAAVLKFTIPQGPKGDAGSTGAAGPGVPIGGSPGQILSKVDSTDYNTMWIAAPSGSGSGGFSQNGNAAWISGKWVDSRVQYGAYSSAARTTNLLLATTLVVPVTTTFNAISVNLSASATGNLRMGLYNALSNGVPGALLAEATVTLGAAGLYQAVIDVTVLPGLYYIASITNSTSTGFPLLSTTGVRPVYSTDAGAGPNNNMFMVSNSAYLTALPNPWPNTAYTGLAGSPPMISLKIA